MPATNTDQEGVITLKDDEGNLTHIVYKDPLSRKNVIYTVQEAGFDELEELLKRHVP